MQKIESLSDNKVNYFEPASIEIDPVLLKLSDFDIYKSKEISEMDFEYCYDWYYILKIRELNEMKLKISEWETIKKKN